MVIVESDLLAIMLSFVTLMSSLMFNTIEETMTGYWIKRLQRMRFAIFAKCEITKYKNWFENLTPVYVIQQKSLNLLTIFLHQSVNHYEIVEFSYNSTPKIFKIYQHNQKWRNNWSQTGFLLSLWQNVAQMQQKITFLKLFFPWQFPLWCK